MIREIEQRSYKGKMLDPYPFGELKEVGEELIVFGANALGFQAAASSYGRYHGMKFLTRSLGVVDGKATMYIRRLKFEPRAPKKARVTESDTNNLPEVV